MNHSYYQKWQFYIQISRTYECTNKGTHFFISRRLFVNVGVLSVFYSKSPCLIFLGHFAVFFFNFSDIFLISPTSDPSDFLLNRAVRAVLLIKKDFEKKKIWGDLKKDFRWFNHILHFQTEYHPQCHWLNGTEGDIQSVLDGHFHS